MTSDSERAEKWRDIRRKVMTKLRREGPIEWARLQDWIWEVYRTESDEDFVMGPLLDQNAVRKGDGGYYAVE